MDLWGALGLSRDAGLLAAAAGLLVAVALSGAIALRRRRDGRRRGLGLLDR
jgi:hypothetical protein